MIYIEKGQKIAENENIVVFSETGDYNDFDLIEYSKIDTPESPMGAFQAQFVKYGGLVYKFSDPEELGKEILKIDFTSKHGAAEFARTMKNMRIQMGEGTFGETATTNTPAPETEETTPEESKEEVPTETPIASSPEAVEETSEEPEKIVTPETSSTTPEISSTIPETSSTTPNVLGEILENASTTLDTIASTTEDIASTTPIITE